MATAPNTRVEVIACSSETLAGRSLSYSHFTRHAFTRLYLPQLLPKAERVLYLDADTLISADVA